MLDAALQEQLREALSALTLCDMHLRPPAPALEFAVWAHAVAGAGDLNPPPGAGPAPYAPPAWVPVEAAALAPRTTAVTAAMAAAAGAPAEATLVPLRTIDGGGVLLQVAVKQHPA